MLESLEARVRVWDESTKIGDIFIKISDFLSAPYSDYCNSYETAHATLSELMKNDGFAKFCRVRWSSTAFRPAP